MRSFVLKNVCFDFWRIPDHAALALPNGVMKKSLASTVGKLRDRLDPLINMGREGPFLLLMPVGMAVRTEGGTDPPRE